MGALALGFAACSSEEEVVNVNPTFDGNAVKAEFALKLPSKVATRQQTAITQDDGTVESFRGIALADLYIAPFATPVAKDADPVGTSDVKVGDITLTSDITLTQHTNANDKWYTDVTVPVGTNAFLVYAEATKSGNDAQNGSLTPSVEDPITALSAVNFELKQISTGNLDGSAILAALNALPVVEGLANSTATDAKAWKDLSATEDNQFYADLYAVFASLKAGSRTDVLAFLKDQLKPALIINTGAGENGIDAKLATAVDEAIAAVEAAPDFTAEAGVPDGAAVLKCTDGVFEYVTTDFISGAKWGQNVYSYPASLWYRANTGIRADDAIQSTNVADQKWDAFIGSAYQAANNTVKASTQSVALVNPLQYAVANFQTEIKFAKESYQIDKVVTIDESTDPATETVEEKATVKPAELALNGILVGDQKNVDWQFKPVVDADPVVIYDTDLIAKTFGTAFSVASQTLVLETSADKKQVNVALEFINNSEVPIKGIDGIVPVGSKFYLIGQLSLDPKNWTEETTGEKDLIFQQDYKTIAKFTINSLENTAYNTIPDLRAPELEFGLSVDLEWQKGYTFEIEVGN